MADRPEDMNFPKILFFHINRILQISGLDRRMFISYVDVFEDVLTPYLDGDYTDRVEKHRQSMLKEMEEASPFAGGEPLDNKVLFSRAKFRELMSVAQEKNLLLQEDSIGEIR